MDSIFDNIPKGEEDPIMSSLIKFKDSKNENKMNLTIGMIKDDSGTKLKVLSSVDQAEKQIHNENLNKEYPPMAGSPDFLAAIQNLIFPKEKFDQNSLNLLVIQCITGGGALRSGAELIKELISDTIYLSNYTFSPYKYMFKDLKIEYYPYYDNLRKNFDFDNFISFLEKLEEKSVINFQLSSHNPTGLDPSKEQWIKISNVCSEKNFLAYFDIAYLGYGSGSIEEDLYAIHLFQRKNIEMIIAYSSGKSFMNYCDDVGALIISTKENQVLSKIKSHLFVINRGLFSFSSIYGSRIITRILNSESLKELWIKELSETWSRISLIRKSLLDELEKENLSNLDFYKMQKGIYLFLDISKKQSDYLENNYSIFIVPGGRISISSLPLEKINYFVKALKDTLNN